VTAEPSAQVDLGVLRSLAESARDDDGSTRYSYGGTTTRHQREFTEAVSPDVLLSLLDRLRRAEDALATIAWATARPEGD
jgi:hypothetical protein